MNVKISVLIPSKGSPRNVALTICNLASMAARLEDLEFVVVIDRNDPDADDYRRVIDSLWEMKFDVRLVHSKFSGYSAIATMYEEAYQASTGDLIWLYNDDCRVMTRNFDDLYVDAMSRRSFSVAACDTNEGSVKAGDGEGHYIWAFPMIRRDLCYAIGDTLLINPAVGQLDRVCDAYAALTGNGVVVKVLIDHKRTPLVPGSEREKHYLQTEANWNLWLAKWISVAHSMQAALMGLKTVIPWPGGIISEKDL